MFHCLVIKVVCLSSLCDSLFTLSYLSDLVKHFFQKFFRFSRSCLKLFVSVVLFKRLGYFIISSVDLSTVNLNFLKTILFFSISEAIPCDSLFTIPLPQGIVKHFFTKKFIFFYNIIFKILFLQSLTFALRHDSVNTYNKFIIFIPFSPVWRFLCISSNHQH